MKKIRLSKSCISEKEIAAVVAVMREEFLGMGQEVKVFEEALANFLETDMNVVCVNTGTSALLLSLSSIDIKRGDEILVPSLTYVASFQAISALGATPIPCDVLSDTLFLDVNDARKRITARTKAIMPVHYAGSAKGISEVYALANEYGLRVVEDAAHSFGGVGVGQSGDLVCFSFDGIKNITSGEGGAILTSDDALAQRLRDERLLGVMGDSVKRFSRGRSWDFDVEYQGYRFHMTNLNAAIGLEQLKRISHFAERRREIANTYLTALNAIPDVSFLNFDYEKIIPHIFVIKAQNRDELRQKLLEEGVETGIHYKPNHFLKKYKCGYRLATVEAEYSCLLSLPCHPDLDEEEQRHIIDVIRDFYIKISQ